MENVREFLNNVFNNVREFFRSPSSPRTFILIGLIILAIALPVTVVVLQQQTNIFQRASAPSCKAAGGVCVGPQLCSHNFNYCKTGYDCASGFVCGMDTLPTPTPTPAPKLDNAKCNNYANSKGYDGGACTGSGTCRAEGATILGNSYCYDGTVGSLTCCGFPKPTPTPKPDVNQCSAKNHPYTGPDGKTHYTSKATCAKYNCANGYVSIGGACTGDSVCCLSASEYGGSGYKVQYTCSNNGSAFQGADGSYTYCPSGKACKPKTQYATNNGINDASSHLCVYATDACAVRGGTCEKYQCGTGEVQTAGSCTIGDSICCIKGTATYSCIFQSGDLSTPNNDYKTSAGDVQWCKDNQYCSGQNQTSVGGVCHDIDPKSCSCDPNDHAHRSFTCNNGAVRRACGNTLICSDSNKGAQGGLWPCVKPSDQVSCGSSGNGVCFWHANVPPDSWNAAYCDTNSVTNSEGKACWEYDTAKLPTCDTLIPGSTQGDNSNCNAVHQTVNANSICCIPPAKPNPSCSDGKESGTCFTNNSCGAFAHEINSTKSPTCGSQGYRICCAPGKTTCGTEGSVCCVSGNKCNNGLTCNSSDTCVKSGGGGGGCTNGKDTKLALSVKLTGIGTSTFENNNPAHPNRTGKVRVYDAASPSKNIHGSSQAFNHGKSNGKFDSATVDIGKGLACSATYKVEVRLPGYLPASAEVKYGETSQVINLEPLPGDINRVDSNGVIIGDGKIDINDYSIYRQCRNQDANTPIDFKSDTADIQVKCGELINFYDFQDGGTMESNVFTPSGIGEWDANYNLWLRSYIKANGH